MHETKSVNLRDICGTEILSGAQEGRRVLMQLVERVLETAEAQVLFLDFKDVEVATASFLRSAVFEFRDTLRRHQSSRYVVAANANSSVVDELAELAKYTSDALLICSLDEKGQPTGFRLLGQLDSKQQLTFELVNQLHEADVSAIVEASPTKEKIGKTAWNNRLASLEGRGLIMELRQSRPKRYKSIYLGASNGN
jgi:hypothetical protein